SSTSSTPCASTRTRTRGTTTSTPTRASGTRGRTAAAPIPGTGRGTRRAISRCRRWTSCRNCGRCTCWRCLLIASTYMCITTSLALCVVEVIDLLTLTVSRLRSADQPHLLSAQPLAELTQLSVRQVADGVARRVPGVRTLEQPIPLLRRAPLGGPGRREEQDRA